MLVLTRKKAESIKIGKDIVIKVIHLSRGVVKLGIEAPANVRVLRAELAEFATVSVANDRESRATVESDEEETSDSVSDEECYHDFHLDHDVEVDDLMTCVGAP
jgi:carbon storage regulator